MKKVAGSNRLVNALLASSLLSVALYLIGTVRYDSTDFWFLNWNLFLAWLPLLLVLCLVKYLKENQWLSWQGILLTLLWLSFLPNSFYLISDLMHLNSLYIADPLYFAVMIFSFSFNGLVLGFTSMYLIHRQLLKRLKPPRLAHGCIAFVLLLCSFAIYLGRYMRWNTWDIILNPAGVVFDVSDRIINPVAHGQTFQVTALFFVLLGSMYWVLWEIVAALQQKK